MCAVCGVFFLCFKSFFWRAILYSIKLKGIFDTCANCFFFFDFVIDTYFHYWTTTNWSNRKKNWYSFCYYREPKQNNRLTRKTRKNKQKSLTNLLMIVFEILNENWRKFCFGKNFYGKVSIFKLEKFDTIFWHFSFVSFFFALTTHRTHANDFDFWLFFCYFFSLFNKKKTDPNRNLKPSMIIRTEKKDRKQQRERMKHLTLFGSPLFVHTEKNSAKLRLLQSLPSSLSLSSND